VQGSTGHTASRNFTAVLTTIDTKQRNASALNRNNSDDNCTARDATQWTSHQYVVEYVTLCYTAHCGSLTGMLTTAVMIGELLAFFSKNTCKQTQPQTQHIGVAGNMHTVNHTRNHMIDHQAPDTCTQNVHNPHEILQQRHMASV